MAKNIQLNGSELAGFIKERQYREVISRPRAQRLVILTDNSNEPSKIYTRIKQQFAADIGIGLSIVELDESDAVSVIEILNNDSGVGGIVIQLPLREVNLAETLINHLDKNKDVDGLKLDSPFDAPTMTAVMWLLAGYNLDLKGKKIALVGHGRLVGKPLSILFSEQELDFTVIHEATTDSEVLIRESDVIISGVGKPDIVRSDWIKPGSIVIDAGVASENGVMKGDIEERAKLRTDISITPLKGGVGPLTVCALFDNFLKATQQ